MLKVENLIKNTPSKLHHKHQRRGLCWYVNDLTDRIMLICKTFAGDALLFLKIIDTRNPEDVSNFDLKSITSWTYQWKMRFNYDSKKQGNEVIFSWKSNTSICPPVTFNKKYYCYMSSSKTPGCSPWFKIRL